MKNVMKRAWEIKKEMDRKTKGQLINLNKLSFGDKLPKEEEAIFSECLKLAWEERKQAEKIAENMNITLEYASKMAEKETNYKMTECEFGIAVFTWNIWEKYGKKRAYYKISTRSKYANGRNEFIDLVA